MPRTVAAPAKRPERSSTPTPPVHCAHTQIVRLDSLKPHPRNPNRHPKAQVELLAKIITTTGWRAPITVSTRSGKIIRGHARLEAAKTAGITEAPVDFQDYADEAAELADLVADNQIAELSHMDRQTLTAIARDLQEVAQFDPATIGIAPADFEDLLAAYEIDVDIVDEFIGTAVERKMDAVSKETITVTLTASTDILTQEVRADIRRRYHPLGISIKEAEL